MAVAALRIVGDDDVWAQLPDDRDEFADSLAHIGVDEPLPVPRRGSLHSRIAPPARSAEEMRFADAEGVQRRGQFADAVAAQLVGGVDSKVRISLTDDLAFFAEGAGDDVHVGAASGVMRNGSTGCQCFVVRVGVDEQQTRGFLRRHPLTRYRRLRNSLSGASVFSRHFTDGSVGGLTA